MRRVLKIGLLTVAAAILLLAGSAAALLVLMDDADYRRLASYLVERATGRTMIVDGRFAVYPSLHPSLVMSKVRIANPPWAAGPDLAQIDHVEVQIALRPLLSRTLVVERLILNDATFALERNADGEANWAVRSEGDDDRMLGGFVPVFGTIRVRNVEWTYRDDARDRNTAMSLAHLTFQENGATAQLDAAGVWDGQQMTARGTFGTLNDALEPTKPFPVDLAVDLPGLDLSARGTIADPAGGRGMDLRLAGHSDDVGPFLERLDSKAPLSGPLELEATLRGDFDAVQVADLRLGVGEEKRPVLQVSGAIEAVNPGGAKLLDGIAVQVRGTTSTTVLSAWLGHPLPDLGEIQGQFMLGGTSEALNVTEMTLQAGAGDAWSIAASGGIEGIRLDRDLTLQSADLNLEAAAKDLTDLGPILGWSLPARGAFSYTGTLSGDPDKWTLAGEARLAGTAIKETFTGSLAGEPPRLSGELAVTLAGLELTARGTVADAAKGQGLDLHLVGHAADLSRVLALLGHEAPGGTRLAAEATVGGDLEALHVTDLHLSLGQGAAPKSQPVLQATGQIASVTPGAAVLLDGIALQVQSATSTTALASWLGRPLPDLGPLDGRFTLTGSSRAAKITKVQLRAGTADRLIIAATGGIAEIRPGRDPTVRGADLELDVRAPDPAVLAAALDLPLPPLGALTYAGRLSGSADMWALAGKVHVGKTVIDGDLTGSFDGARPRISGRLSTPVLHLADFGVASDAAPNDRDPKPADADSSDWASSAASLDALDAVDLDLTVDVDQVEGTKLAIGRGEVDLALANGVLRIDPARFDFVAGTALLHATADARWAPPQIDLSLHVDDVQLGELLMAMGATAPITGELALILKLESRGESAEALVDSLDGEVSFAIQRGDVDLSVNLATADLVTWLLAGAQRGTSLLRRAPRSGRTKLDCLVGRFGVERGVATAQSLLMKTPLTLSTASGTLDLVDRTIDLVVHLRARRGSLFDPATTYRIHGPMGDPALDFSKTGFLARAIAGVVMKPFDALGSLLPLVDDGGKDKDNPCLQ